MTVTNDMKTLTRSKLVTREISEVLNYKTFGNSMVAVHVKVTVVGVDPFKADHYAVMEHAEFDKAMAVVAKSKKDFPFRDILIKQDQSFQWYKFTAAEIKSFKKLPTSNRKGNNAYELVLADQEDRSDEKISAARPKKIYQAAINKPHLLVHFKHYDHTFRDVNGTLISLPVFIDHGVTSSDYLMKSLVDYLRTLDNVGMVVDEQIHQSSPHKDYPEIKSVPYYNAEREGETEVKFWVLPTDEQYHILKGGEKYVGADIWSILKYGVLDLSPFKIARNDD